MSSVARGMIPFASSCPPSMVYVLPEPIMQALQVTIIPTHACNYLPYGTPL